MISLSAESVEMLRPFVVRAIQARHGQVRFRDWQATHEGHQTMSIDIDQFIAGLKSLVIDVDLTPLYNDVGTVGEFVGGATDWITSGRAERDGGQTLMDTGQLATSITKEVTSKGVTIGTNKVYGAIHHFGGKAGRGLLLTIPARPHLVVQEEDYENIQDTAL